MGSPLILDTSKVDMLRDPHACGTLLYYTPSLTTPFQLMRLYLGSSVRKGEEAGFMLK